MIRCCIQREDNILPDFDSFKENLLNLVAKFEKDREHYLSKGYPEAQVRIDFLNPLFDALGWDIENKAHKAPHERDIIVELSPEATGRPDYNFRLKGDTKFFVEAKAPSVSLDDVNHVLQAKAYAWSTKTVYFVVLTDFEEFKLFDASLRPSLRFPSEGLLFDFKYTDYLSNAEELWKLSKESVENGSLEALLPKDTKSKRLRVPPDKSFLEDLTAWRTEIAKDVHKRNPGFDVKLLNDVVQKLLDRIIFVRIAEDRKIRPDRELWEIVAQWKEEGRRKTIMSHLVELFCEVNDDLNGDIFKPHACETANVDSDLLAEIIESLYFPKSRYRFDAIGVELLGSIYERYLGSTIRVTPQRVKVEEKPEVRKAGGVYYTPKYIVDYIVKNTVGKIIEGKTPRQIEKIKILDPACGSGSFLLGAYQYLIDYHLKYYRNHPKEAQTLHLFPYWKISPEELSLPLHEKANFLRNNIFGCDIDPQAVEITMMSLYLKALEGERSLLPKKQHLLPSLGDNIKCGNSLIGYDIMDGQLFDDDTKSRINFFDWDSKSTGFGEITANGGFDVVIGNPPYVRIQAMKEWAPVEVEFYKHKYVSASKGNYDIYVVFVEKGLSLLNNRGRMGFILPHKFFNAQYGKPVRELLAKGNHLSHIVHFGHQQVFEGATTYTCLMFLNKEGDKSCLVEKVDNLVEWQESGRSVTGKIAANKINGTEWNFTVGAAASLYERLANMPVKLGDIAHIFVGTQTSADDVFVLDHCRIDDQYIIGMSKALDKQVKVEVSSTRHFLRGRQIRRYEPPQTSSYVICPYEISSNEFRLFTLTEMEKKFPLTLAYLRENRAALSAREKGRLKGAAWHAFGYPKSMTLFQKPKIIVPDYNNVAAFTFDPDGHYYKTGYGVIVEDDNLSPLFILGLLNSSLLFKYLLSIGTSLRGGYVRFWTQFIEQLPIRSIDFNNPLEKAVHNKLVDHVEHMLAMHKKKSALPPSAEREKIEREIAITDEKIDDIVYDLYGITDEEKIIIERNGF